MAEPIEPEHEPKPESPETDAADADQTDPDMDTDDAPPEDPDIRTGFSAEQRRFLWTLAGLNVVAVLLGAAIIVAYLASARSQDAAIVKYTDDYQTATEAFQRAEQIDIARAVNAELAGNKDASTEAQQSLVEAYSNRETARAQLRHAQGLPASDVTDDKIMQFAANVEHVVSQAVAAHASTQPASKPAKEKESATKP